MKKLQLKVIIDGEDLGTKSYHPGEFPRALVDLNEVIKEHADCLMFPKMVKVSDVQFILTQMFNEERWHDETLTKLVQRLRHYLTRGGD